MRFSDVFAASLVAPLVAAHGGDIPGAPRLFGVPKNLRARNPWAGHQNIGHAAGPVAAPKLQARQGGADGRCGADGGGASCAAGYCCSSSGWCGNTNEYCAAPDCQINFGTGCDANKTPYGATTRNDPRPQLGSIAYGGVGIRECVKPKTVAITYDDGPYKYTEAVMSQFEKLGGRATFFITGNNLGKGSIDENWRDVISKMYANGHQIASHTWSHQNLDEITQQQRFDQMVKNEMAIRNIIGKYPTYMRPPYSACNTAACQADLKTLGYVSTSFDLDTDDYNQLTKEKIQIAKDNFKKGMDLAGANGDALAIAHDIHELTAMNLTAYMLESVYSKGWTAVTVGECMGDPKANWYRDSAAGVRPSATPSSSAPVPTPTGPTSVNGQCGSTTAGAGQSCIGFVGPDGISECCSQSGWCGRSADHCGTGCNPLFGKCGTQPSISASATISKTSAAPLPTVSLETSADGLCGATAGKTCKGFLLDGAKAECCSQYGYCGNTDAHCGLACNPIYGNCGSSGSSSSAVVSSAASSSASVSKSASASASASVSKSASASASASVSKASSAVSSTSAHASISASASASASASISKSASASASASVSKASSAASSSSASASKYDVSISTSASASASASVTKHESSPVPVTVSSSATPSASASKHESSPIPDTKTPASTPATSVYSVNTPSPSSSKAVPSSTGYPDQATTQVYPSTMSTLVKPTSTPCDDDKVAKPTPTGPPVSKDGKCGKDNGGQTCAGYKNPFGQTIECCCKESGRCSTDPWACGVGCDPKFGNCNKY